MSERSVPVNNVNAAELKKRLYDEGKVVCGCSLSGDLRLALEKMVETMRTNDCRGILATTMNNDIVAKVFVYGCPHRVKVLQVFLDNEIDINIQTDAGYTALMMASQQKIKASVQLLLSRGANMERQGYQGWTALIIACIYNSMKPVELLLNHGADANIQDRGGWTALMFASTEGRKGRKGIVELLLNHGANPDIQNYDNGHTALMLASSQGHKDIVQLLLNHGVDIKLKNCHGQTAEDIPTTTEIKEMLKNHVATTHVDTSYVLK